MNINKINKDMMHVLEEVQKVQQTFMLDFSIVVNVHHYQKGFRIIADFEDVKESERNQLGAYHGRYNFDCRHTKEDMEEMLNELRKGAITLKHMRDNQEMKKIEL